MLAWTTQKALRQARFTRLICAFAAPALYAGAIAMQNLGGRWARFLERPDRIPWHDPRVPWLLGLALAALAAALLAPMRLKAGADPLRALRLGNLLASVLLLVTAMCGLYTGMKLGSAAAPLAAAMLAAPVLAGLRQFPTTIRWERDLEG